MTHQFHKFWLKITSIIVAIAAPFFFLGSMSKYSLFAEYTLDIISWPLDGIQNYQDPTTRFLSALTGGFLLGWGVLFWCLSIYVYDKAPEFVRKSVLISLSSWFVLDSTGSILSGNESNAITNVFVLLITIGPLLIPAKNK